MRKRTNVGGLTEGMRKVEAVEGSTEARRKDESGSTEVKKFLHSSRTKSIHVNSRTTDSATTGSRIDSDSTRRIIR